MAKLSYKGIYAITINDKSYVGQDSNIFKCKRLQNHITALKKNEHNNTKMQDDFNIYGMDKLTYTILTFSLDYTKEDLNRLEKYYIKELNTYESDFGYNQTLGGIGMLGFVTSTETLEKRSENTSAEKNPNAKITNDQFFEMVELFKQGKSNIEIANIYGLHDRYVSLIRHKKRFKSLWNQVSNYDPINSHFLKDRRRLSYTDFLIIVQMIENGESNEAIQRKFNFASGTGSRIRHKKLYRDYWQRYETESLIN